MILTILLIAVAATGETPEQVFFEGNAAYEAGDHDAASTRYEQLVTSGVENGYLYYNLGNALLRQGRLGRAIAAYRKARSLLPRDSDVRANLAFARDATKDAIAPQDPSAVLRTLFFWHFSFNPRELLLLLLVANLCFWAALAWQQVRRASELLRWAVVLLFFAVLALGISFAIRTVKPEQIAVINTYEAEVRSGISRDTVVRFKLHEGTETEVLEVEGDWVRIGLPDGKQGWVETAEILLVSL